MSRLGFHVVSCMYLNSSSCGRVVFQLPRQVWESRGASGQSYWFRFNLIIYLTWMFNVFVPLQNPSDLQGLNVHMSHTI